MITTLCPRCNRDAVTENGRYKRHGVTHGSIAVCPMTNQLEIVTGMTDEDFDRRAAVVADLAEQVQDVDPALVWEYLTALPAVELQRLVMIAFAAVPVDKTVEQMFAWVTELPVAKAVSA